jgi:Sugar (pentulose and hexulose) kinases
MNNPYFIGIDIGTQGARVVLVDVQGNLVASASQNFPLTDHWREEQSPLQWWNQCLLCLQQVIKQAKTSISLADICAISVTSTSGTIIPMGKNNKPLYNAIMYSDTRSGAEARQCKEVALAAHSTGYTAFNASSGLPKMLWFMNQYPEKVKEIGGFIHATDFIIGKLCGRFNVTDYTNALKSGYDIRNYTWPSYILELLPIQIEWLPEVQASGTAIGTITHELANILGLPHTVQVVAGMTDGCAAQVASGAVNVGDWNTTIGTTLVVKGVTTREINDPLGRLYCHRHPEGYWMPGGASNTGADWIAQDFGNELDALNQQAAGLIPTPHLAWPLKQKGERFPFMAPEARGFYPDAVSKAALFAANMEGVAYIERYAYDMIEQLSGEKPGSVYTAGGGSNSDVWLQIRSNVLQLPVYKMKHVTGAVGAAILAASKTHFHSIVDAAKALTQIEKEIHPRTDWMEIYQKNYQRFINTLVQKGYIQHKTYA